MNRRARKGRRDAAFTLIELMVVILLIGVGFSYGLIRLDVLLPRSRLEKAARGIGTTLTRLREMAVFGGRSYYLEYDLDEHRYRIYRPTTEAEQADGAPDYLETTWSDLPDRVRIEDIQYASNERVERGRFEIEFTPEGEVAGHLVHLISDDIAEDDRKYFTVELNPITGLVSYEAGKKEYAQVRDEYDFR